MSGPVPLLFRCLSEGLFPCVIDAVLRLRVPVEILTLLPCTLAEYHRYGESARLYSFDIVQFFLFTDRCDPVVDIDFSRI